MLATTRTNTLGWLQRPFLIFCTLSNALRFLWFGAVLPSVSPSVVGSGILIPDWFPFVTRTKGYFCTATWVGSKISFSFCGVLYLPYASLPRVKQPLRYVRPPSRVDSPRLCYQHMLITAVLRVC